LHIFALKNWKCQFFSFSLLTMTPINHSFKPERDAHQKFKEAEMAENQEPKIKDPRKAKHAALMAEKILAVRERLGLTQTQFAKLVQVKPNTIAFWEQKRVAPGNNSTKVIENIEEMIKDEDFVRVVQDSLHEKDGIEAAAVLIGLIMGLTKATGASLRPGQGHAQARINVSQSGGRVFGAGG
jgi:DNA-binding transcriptional regulator YiaG